MTPEERFWSKVNKTEECWLWTAAVDKAGYGRFGDRYAHRYVYELKVGPVPQGLQIDHLCRVRHCVNPDHLEPVTQRENILRSPISVAAVNARKTHCPRGHRYSILDNRGWRECRPCRNLQYRRRYAEKASA